MRNVTVSLDDETARWARVEAARRDTSESGLLREFLEQAKAAHESYPDAMERDRSRAPLRLKKRRRYPAREELHDRSVFVDTSVLLYARDASEPKKQPLASAWLDVLWEQRSGRLSYQVLNEYYVTVTRKLRPGRSREAAQADIRDLLSWRPIGMDAEMLMDAWWVEERFGLSYWEAQIVAAACDAGCAILLSEGFQHGQDLDGVIVTNPFVTKPREVGLAYPGLRGHPIREPGPTQLSVSRAPDV